MYDPEDEGIDAARDENVCPEGDLPTWDTRSRDRFVEAVRAGDGAAHRFNPISSTVANRPLTCEIAGEGPFL